MASLPQSAAEKAVTPGVAEWQWQGPVLVMPSFRRKSRQRPSDRDDLHVGDALAGQDVRRQDEKSAKIAVADADAARRGV